MGECQGVRMERHFSPIWRRNSHLYDENHQSRLACLFHYKLCLFFISQSPSHVHFSSMTWLRALILVNAQNINNPPPPSSLKSHYVYSLSLLIHITLRVWVYGLIVFPQSGNRPPSNFDNITWAVNILNHWKLKEKAQFLRVKKHEECVVHGSFWGKIMYFGNFHFILCYCSMVPLIFLVMLL